MEPSRITWFKAYQRWTGIVSVMKSRNKGGREIEGNRGREREREIGRETKGQRKKEIAPLIRIGPREGEEKAFKALSSL